MLQPPKHEAGDSAQDAGFRASILSFSLLFYVINNSRKHAHGHRWTHVFLAYDAKHDTQIFL